MAPRIKIEDVLPSGEKISITLEGPEISEKRVLQVLELLKIMSGGGPGVAPAGRRSIKEELWDIILENFGDGTWFSIHDVYSVARRKLDIPITSVSTYITRLVNEGRLIKRGAKPRTRYRVRVIASEV